MSPFGSHPLHDAFDALAPWWLRHDAGRRWLAIDRQVGLLRAMEGACHWSQAFAGLPASLAVEGLEQVPAEGPLVVVANHPFAVVDVFALGAALERVRPRGGVFAVVDAASDTFVEMHPIVCSVGSDAAGRERFWARSFARLEAGGALVVFPAGHSLVRDRWGTAMETPWRAGALKLAARSGATLLPAHLVARNRRRYHALRRHLPRTTVQKLNLKEAHRFSGTVRVRFGAPLSVDGATPEGLRDAVYALGDERFVRAPSRGSGVGASMR